MTENKKKLAAKEVLIVCSFVVLITALYIASHNYAHPEHRCYCTKLASTNIPVTDYDSLGSAIAFYVSEPLEVLNAETITKCNNNYYHMNFATFGNKNQSLYADEMGNIYKCHP